MCGGQDTNLDFQDCYIYQLANDTWDHFAPMKDRRQSATSVQLSDNDFWIAGGLDSDGNKMSSTEIYVSATGQFEYGPDLPFSVSGHCMARINDTHYVMSGGRTDIDNLVTTKTMLYNIDDDVWTEIGNMVDERCQPIKADLVHLLIAKTYFSTCTRR